MTPEELVNIPVGVGDRAAQLRFLERYKPFLAEYPRLSALMNKTFLGPLRKPSEEERTSVADLPDEDPRAIAFEDTVMADYVIFYLGRIVADDFGEIINLAGNGQGLGAFKILRGMYERIVTASFIAKSPTEARRFMDDEAIQQWKLWNSALKLTPDMKNRFSEQKIKDMEEANKAARAKKKESVCNKCRQPLTDEAWTRVDLASMAEKADYNLAILYGWCYVEPTLHSHATSFAISHRIRRNDDDTGWTYRDLTEQEARRALHFAHNLILRALALHDDHFKLGLESEIQARIDAFPKAWEGIPHLDASGHIQAMSNSDQ